MAPEVIELREVCAESDVWSLGCTLIELITGNPPYSEYNPMTALFKIVEEEMMIPESVSSSLQSFMSACFVKDPKGRANTEKLLKHSWIVKKDAQKSRNNSILFNTERRNTNQTMDSRKPSTAENGLVKRKETAICVIS